MNLFQNDIGKERVIFQAAQRSPQIWALGIGTLLINAIVMILGHAYMVKMLAAEDKIHDLEATIQELLEGDTNVGLGYRLTQVENMTNIHDGQITDIDVLVTS